MLPTVLANAATPAQPVRILHPKPIPHTTLALYLNMFVRLLSTPEERAALYDQVFQPVVKALKPIK